LVGAAAGTVINSIAVAAARTKAIFIIGVLRALIQEAPVLRDLGLPVVALHRSS
jgi:hypothetical protein